MSTWGERLRRDIKWVLQGGGISLVAHLLLVVILAVIVIHSERPLFLNTLEMGWIDEPAARQPDLPPEPVRMTPFALPNTGAATTKTAERKPAATSSADPKPESLPPAPIAPVDVSGSLANRSPRGRKAALRSLAGDDAEPIERAISSGLAWLARQQQSDGRWQLHTGYPDAGRETLRTDTGATALALLAFLGDGHGHPGGEYHAQVSRGLEWLVHQQQANGDLHDSTELGRQTAFYAHSQATIAICEAYAISGDGTLQGAARLAVDYLLRSQHPSRGGWKYLPQTELTTGDLSVTGWALMALHTARMAGIEVPLEAYERSSKFLDTVQEYGGTRYKYMAGDPADRVTLPMTATGFLCRQWLGLPADEGRLQKAIPYFIREENRPRWEEGLRNVYAWYYIGQVLHNVGGENWTNWYGEAQHEIVRAQTRLGSSRPGDDIRGSWHPLRPRGSEWEYAEHGGRLYLTAMSLLVLETPYRHRSLSDEKTASLNSAVNAAQTERTNFNR